MPPRLQFSHFYFFTFLILFVTEVVIAVFVHDHFVRPYVGDVLVVMLIYCFVRSLLQASWLPVITGVLLFAFLIEGLQYLHFVERLGLAEHPIAPVVLGNSFAWEDILAYVVGALIVVVIEQLKAGRLEA